MVDQMNKMRSSYVIKLVKQTDNGRRHNVHVKLVQQYKRWNNIKPTWGEWPAVQVKSKVKFVLYLRRNIIMNNVFLLMCLSIPMQNLLDYVIVDQCLLKVEPQCVTMTQQ